MESIDQPRSMDITLFVERGTIKSVINYQLILERQNAPPLEIYVPSNFPASAGESVEIAFEITPAGFFARQVRIDRSNESLPILPYEYVMLGEYLRIGLVFFALFLTSVLTNLLVPHFILAIVIPLFCGEYFCFYWLGALIVGKNVPNYAKSPLLDFRTIHLENLQEYVTPRMIPPLFAVHGTIKNSEYNSTQLLLVMEKGQLEIIQPPGQQRVKHPGGEGNWAFRFRDDRISILGQILENGKIRWQLSKLLASGIVFEFVGVVIFFLGLLPGFWVFTPGSSSPFPSDLAPWFFVTCLLIGLSLMVLGQLTRMKNSRLKNSIIVNYVQ